MDARPARSRWRSWWEFRAIAPWRAAPPTRLRTRQHRAGRSTAAEANRRPRSRVVGIRGTAAGRRQPDVRSGFLAGLARWRWELAEWELVSRSAWGQLSFWVLAGRSAQMSRAG